MNLSLNQKISIKGELAKRGIVSLAAMNTKKEAIHYWNMAYGTSILKFLNPTRYKTLRLDIRGPSFGIDYLQKMAS
jgi:hypothetical protein